MVDSISEKVQSPVFVLTFRKLLNNPVHYLEVIILLPQICALVGKILK